MKPTSIRLAALGQLPTDFDLHKLLRWKSTVFELSPDVESFQLNEDAEGDDWEYTDEQLAKYLDKPFGEDFLVIVVNVKLQDNWYVRRLSGNRVLFTFYELREILSASNIPLQNMVLRVLYGATLLFKRFGERFPAADEPTDYAHDEMRGCLFDMNASKWDVVHSCHEPIVCDCCVAELKKAQVSNEAITTTQSEIKRIRKPLFYRIGDFVRRHPIWSILISIVTALIVGILSSVLGAYIYAYLTVGA